MNGFQPKPPTAKQIDEACRAGWFVYIGNRQRVLGAVAHRKGEVTLQGRVWVNKASDLSWEYVPAGSVTITTETFGDRKDNHMATGKRAAGRPSHVRSRSSKKGARANNDNLELPGANIDARKIVAIEEAEEARQAQSGKSSKAIEKAHKDLEEAEQAVVDAMHSNGFDAKKRPVYTRVPWGSVILQQKGKITESVKFVSSEKKIRKKKNKDDIEDESGE